MTKILLKSLVSTGKGLCIKSSKDHLKEKKKIERVKGPVCAAAALEFHQPSRPPLLLQSILNLFLFHFPERVKASQWNRWRRQCWLFELLRRVWLEVILKRVFGDVANLSVLTLLLAKNVTTAGRKKKRTAKELLDSGTKEYRSKVAVGKGDDTNDDGVTVHEKKKYWKNV